MDADRLALLDLDMIGNLAIRQHCSISPLAVLMGGAALGIFAGVWANTR